MPARQDQCCSSGEGLREPFARRFRKRFPPIFGVEPGHQMAHQTRITFRGHRRRGLLPLFAGDHRDGFAEQQQFRVMWADVEHFRQCAVSQYVGVTRSTEFTGQPAELLLQCGWTWNPSGLKTCLDARSRAQDDWPRRLKLLFHACHA
jgi:hypothetical protein